MRTHLRPFAAAACLLAASSLLCAQQPAAQPKKPAADTAAANRRATAINLLNALADEARGFREPTLRARVQAQAADALWETEPERARTLFRRAWDAAEQADQENLRRRDAERRLPPAGGAGAGGGRVNQDSRLIGGPARGGALATALNLPQMRSEVLRLAARRERALGEEFLAKLEEARKQDEKSLAADAVAGAASAGPSAPDASTGGTQQGANPNEATPADARRLQLAMQFLAEGEAERALQFAAPALSLGGVNPMAVEFLVNLREKDAARADQLFLSLLARAAADTATGANAVLILSSYVLTPHLYMTIAPGGGFNSSQRRREITAPELPPAVRAGFAQFAAGVLLRPLPTPDQDPQGLARAGVYFVAGRLLPFFEQTLADRGAALRAQVAAITPDVPEARRNDMADDMKRGLVPSAQRDEEQLQNLLDAASRTSDPATRDRAYAQAAMVASHNNDPKARDYAAKIEDPDLRQQVRTFVDFAAVNSAIQRRDGLEVFKLTQGGELTDTHRTWGYTEAARLLVKDDRPRALEALEAAFESAKKIDAEDPDRPRALVGVATQYAALDRNRAWELMPEAVKAANAAPEFTGSDAGLSARVQMRNSRSTMNFSATSFDLAGVFQLLARDDMNRAAALAQTFTQEGPRAAATLAVARAVLEDKPAAPRPNRAGR